MKMVWMIPGMRMQHASACAPKGANMEDGIFERAHVKAGQLFRGWHGAIEAGRARQDILVVDLANAMVQFAADETLGELQRLRTLLTGLEPRR